MPNQAILLNMLEAEFASVGAKTIVILKFRMVKIDKPSILFGLGTVTRQVVTSERVMRID